MQINVNDEEIFFVKRMKKTEKSAPNAWSNKPPPRNLRTPARNIIRTLPGVKGRARTLGNLPEKKQVWDLLFDQTILDAIVTNINIKLQSVRLGLSERTKKNNYRNTDIEEVNALIGLMLVSSVKNQMTKKLHHYSKMMHLLVQFTQQQCLRRDLKNF